MSELDIDLGNTRLKWRLREGARVLERGALSWAALDAEPGGWVQLTARISAAERIRVGSVAGDARNQQLLDVLAGSGAGVPTFAQTAAQSAGVTNSYADPSRMGVDRWLAAVAAYHRVGGACVVVDCGSAVTVELMSAEGRHCGGYIVPGLRLMRRALFADTDAVKVESASTPLSLAPGTDTAAAVNHGLPLMLLGLIGAAQRYLADARPQLLLTGGDSAALLPLLRSELELEPVLVPELVLDGLALVLP